MGVNITRQFPKGDLWGSLDKAPGGPTQHRLLTAVRLD
jgi:hypothetical protein